MVADSQLNLCDYEEPGAMVLEWIKVAHHVLRVLRSGLMPEDILQFQPTQRIVQPATRRLY